MANTSYRHVSSFTILRSGKGLTVSPADFGAEKKVKGKFPGYLTS